MKQAGAPADTAPVCIIDKNACEQVRAELSVYKGLNLLSVRLWWRRDDSEPWKPSKRGFGLRVDALPELIEGLRRIEAAAVARGWLNDTEPPQPTSTKRAPKGPTQARRTASRTRAREHLDGQSPASLAAAGTDERA
jgi:hypothetical protein